MLRGITIALSYTEKQSRITSGYNSNFYWDNLQIVFHLVTDGDLEVSAEGSVGPSLTTVNTVCDLLVQ